jgi:hypothetical protein
MEDPDRLPTPQARVVVKSIALPVEHGAWGLLLEPLALGLALAPSWAGAWLAVAALFAFLARHPLKLAIADHGRRTRFPRTAWAEAFAAAYGLAAAAAAAAAFACPHAPFLIPLAAAAPLAIVQLLFDAGRHGRSLARELSGVVAASATAAMVALAGGRPLGPALALWAIMAARGVASVVYVRARIRLERSGACDRSATRACHGLGIAVALGLAARGWAPWLAVLAFAILSARAEVGLSPLRRPARPQTIGFQELVFGLMTVLLVVLGHYGRI